MPTHSKIEVERKVKNMAAFNPYSLYSMSAGQATHACDGKIFVDLQRFKSIHDIDEVNEYIDKTFGSFEDKKVFKYPNDVLVFISKTEKEVTVVAHQKEKQIYGNQWYVIEDE